MPRDFEAIFDLSATRPLWRWILLVCLSAAFSGALLAMSVPAGLFLGAMGAGVAVAVAGGTVRVPLLAFSFCQGIIGCLIASRITPAALANMADNWPLLLFMVLSVSFASAFLGWRLAKTGLLPGSTAIWGTSPGAALIMTIMSESYGADSRLVAFMQYLRVLMVTLVATLAASYWGGHATPPATAAAEINPVHFADTMALAVVGVLLSRLLRFPSAPMLFPLVAVPLFGHLGWMSVELPWLALAVAYGIIGWGIGLRFTRRIVAHAMGALPRIALAMAALIGVCAVLGHIFSLLSGVDPLTSFLAASPGGIDSIAIISASVGGDVSLVMTVQTARFIFVTLTGPSIATYITRRTGLARPPSPGKDA